MCVGDGVNARNGLQHERMVLNEIRTAKSPVKRIANVQGLHYRIVGLFLSSWSIGGLPGSS